MSNFRSDLGSRHLAAASISRTVGALAIVVSESAIVRVFHEGADCQIIPELWLFRHHLQPELRGGAEKRQSGIAALGDAIDATVNG